MITVSTVYIWNLCYCHSSEPKIEPCGAPMVQALVCDTALFVRTHRERPDRHDFIQLRVFMYSLYLVAIVRRIEWLIGSKALLEPKKIAPTTPSFSSRLSFIILIRWQHAVSVDCMGCSRTSDCPLPGYLRVYVSVFLDAVSWWRRDRRRMQRNEWVQGEDA